TGGVLGTLIWLSAPRLTRRPILQSFIQSIAIGVFALFVLNEDILQREWALLPEAWATIYLGIQLWLIWSLSSRELTRRALIIRYAALCLSACLLLFTKPNWGLALAALPLPLAIAGALRTRSWRGVLSWSALA